MSRKSNSKSIRLSDEVMEYINEFDGDGFNQKFENIILYAMKTEMERKKRIETLDKLIKDRDQQLQEINSDLQTARKETMRYKEIMFSLKHI